MWFRDVPRVPKCDVQGSHMREKLQKRRNSNDWMEIFLDDDVIMTTLELQCCQLERHFESVSNLAVRDKNSANIFVTYFSHLPNEF